MRRRDFIKVVAGSAAVWPLAVRAQQSAMPVIGFLRSTPFNSSTSLVAAFRQGLKESGFNEGQNVAIEFRFADNQIDRLSGLVDELVRHPVNVIVTNVLGALAAKNASTTVPIVFVTGSDPVKDGLVTSLNRPGGNITGVSFVSGALATKRFEILRQLTPNAKTIAMLVQLDADEAVLEYRWADGQNDRLPRIGGRSGSSSSGRNCRDHHCRGTCSKGGDHNHSDCLRKWR
jgi:putative ABC transport system substrate-binding protein